MKTPRTIAATDLDFAALLREGETVGWAEATAEPVFLTGILSRQAARCAPFRVFFALTFSNDFAANHANVTVTALGGGSTGRRFFAQGADNVIPGNISDLSALMSSASEMASARHTWGARSLNSLMSRSSYRGALSLREACIEAVLLPVRSAGNQIMSWSPNGLRTSR